MLQHSVHGKLNVEIMKANFGSDAIPCVKGLKRFGRQLVFPVLNEQFDSIT